MRLDDLRRQPDISWSNGFVGILGRCLGLPGATLPDIWLTKFLPDILLHPGLSLLRDTRRVGTHVGDETLMATLAQFYTLVKLLRKAHGLFRLEVEPGRGILLQGAGSIGQVRLAALLLLLHFQNSVRGTL